MISNIKSTLYAGIRQFGFNVLLTLHIARFSWLTSYLESCIYVYGGDWPVIFLSYEALVRLSYQDYADLGTPGYLYYLLTIF